ncbi:MAG: DUF3288 family protein [Limnothrix sp.]|uniref:DUF3288 family protein n=2 Tax=Pseudanabaenaceae TaxID=1890436 RepID=A0ABW7CBW6_9CYAN|nr:MULTISPECIES: DUF3288 family protein [unclassified Limnothrix]MEB3119387.1 DUF3288 family protein [Limnothrix sp.]OCQ95236.1 hypothetical protein BCR12_07630 [Limnothrix sp. P13C2]PIB07510.1 hypothetical protein AMR42_14200 [Limnothrix sp. PR1529]RFP61039.1 MAG: DUF3288 family protein [Limnothrix sp. CACIAM 69d]
MKQQDQQHPQEMVDRNLVQAILTSDPTDFYVCELARLRIRYRNFPGARQIQADLDKALSRWGFDEESLYQKTRELHAQGNIYQVNSRRRDEEDWS